MSGQVKKNPEKKLTARQIIDKVLEITKLEQRDLALNCTISPDTLAKAIGRNSLGGKIVGKIHDKYGIAKAFLKEGKEPIQDPNHTPAIKNSKATGNEAGDILDHPLVKSYKDQIDALKDIIVMKEAEIQRLRGKDKN